MTETPRTILVQTLISGKPPRRRARGVALFSVLVCLAASIVYWENFGGIADKLPAIPARVFGHHESWRLFTALFIHSDIEHFLSNAVSLSLLSYLLYGYFGWKVFPVYIVIFSAFTNLLSLLTYPPHIRLLGASGGIYLMAGFWLTLYVGIDRRYPLGNRILRAVGFSLMVLFPTTLNADTSYRTHGFGFAVGIVFGLFYFFVHKNQMRQAERYVVEEPEPEEEAQSPVGIIHLDN